MAERDHITRFESSAVESADPTAEVGAPASHDFRDAETAAHCYRAIDADPPGQNADSFPGRHADGAAGGIYPAVDIDFKIAPAHGNIDCFIKDQDRTDQAEFKNGIPIRIADKGIGHF